VTPTMESNVKTKREDPLSTMRRESIIDNNSVEGDYSVSALVIPHCVIDPVP
jgi:hypothetical protein